MCPHSTERNILVVWKANHERAVSSLVAACAAMAADYPLYGGSIEWVDMYYTWIARHSAGHKSQGNAPLCTRLDAAEGRVQDVLQHTSSDLLRTHGRHLFMPRLACKCDHTSV
jgi:hypothetical protein